LDPDALAQSPEDYPITSRDAPLIGPARRILDQTGVELPQHSKATPDPARCGIEPTHRRRDAGLHPGRSRRTDPTTAPTAATMTRHPTGIG
jgi:hypothetical protein